MKLYFNDSQTPINVVTFYHSIMYNEDKERTEDYSIKLDTNTDVIAIADMYDSTTITSYALKNDDGTKTFKSANNINLHITVLSEDYGEDGADKNMHYIVNT